MRQDETPYVGNPNNTDHEKHKVEKRIVILKVVDWPEIEDKQIPWYLENPYQSRICDIADMKKLLKEKDIRVSLADYCQYGTK